ncbi:hypothetical protein ACLMNJ_15325 [Streptomyces seoulensis]
MVPLLRAMSMKCRAWVRSPAHGERAEYPLDEELRPAPSLLARARRRGDVERLHADLARRLGHLDSPGGIWEATWHSGGALSANRDDGSCVRG